MAHLGDEIPIIFWSDGMFGAVHLFCVNCSVLSHEQILLLFVGL